MKILVVSGYNAWDKVSRGLMPSQHLFGINEIVKEYVEDHGYVRGLIKDDVLDGGYVDFYLWRSDKKAIIQQVQELLKISKQYDLIYDQINRCSIFLGMLKKVGILKCRLLTVLHHPPYDLQLKISDSDAYVLFNEDYRKIAIKSCHKKKDKYFVNEWRPDIEWYKKQIVEPGTATAFYIDNGKSRRDRSLLIEAAEFTKIRIDYAGQKDETIGFARSYAMNLKDDVEMLERLLKYKAVIIPVKKDNKTMIGPLGITSFLDCIALSMPVIASDNVCFAKEIENHKLGLIYDTGNMESLAAALKKLKNDVEFYDNCVHNQQSYAKYTMKDYSRKLVEIIEGIV